MQTLEHGSSCAGLARPAGIGVVIAIGGLGGAKRASGAWMDVVIAALGLVVALVPSLGLELAVWGHFGHSGRDW